MSDYRTKPDPTYNDLMPSPPARLEPLDGEDQFDYADRCNDAIAEYRETLLNTVREHLALAHEAAVRADGGPAGDPFYLMLDEIDRYRRPATRTRRSSRISTSKRTKVYERDEYRCVECGSHKKLSIDHIHPVSKGGTDELDNLQTLCLSCNSSKGAKVPV